MVHDILAPAPFTPSNRSFVISSIITASTHGSLGLVMLRRPEAINALTLGMLEDLTRIFTDFRSDNKISMVILQGAGARGFCAGGDIKDFHAAVSSGEHQRFLELLRLEFALDEMIANYPKPVITMVHGLCMGGGIGLASHASIRITTPEARFALPEARIGYSPDVGSTLLMARAPGHVGEYLALTGTSFTGADAVELGFADMMVSQDRFEEIFEALPDFDSMPAAEIAAGLEVLLASLPLPRSPANSRGLMLPSAHPPFWRSFSGFRRCAIRPPQRRLLPFRPTPPPRCTARWAPCGQHAPRIICARHWIVNCGWPNT